MPMVKPHKVAGEVDSWCTKCRMLLNHRIVSMDKARPYQVLCLTCHTQHLYRANAPGHAAAAAAPAPRGGGGVGAASSMSSRASDRPPRSHGATRAEQARVDRERSWEKAIAGKSLAEFKPYNVSARFNEGDLIRHKKFGEGIVTRVIDAAKVEVLFRDEPRMLAHGLVD